MQSKYLVGNTENIAGIDWRVLAVENDKALLVSEKILEKRRYNVDYRATTWETCTLRKYLNGEFYSGLGTAKSAVAETRNPNPSNPWYGTAGGNTTTDKVFLLSLGEVCSYFGDSAANLRTKGSTGSDYYINDENNSARMAKGAWWWLRSPGHFGNYAAIVGAFGSVYVGGNFVKSCSGGVRPALWLNR